MAGSYTTSVNGIETCGHDIVILRLQRPEGFSYRPGQWFRLALETTAGLQTETFTIASVPSDPDLELATRLSGSPFKAALAALAAGEPVSITGPGGRASLPETASLVAFLVGGVGVTPARSILRDAQARGRRFDDALVLYGNRDASCVPYLDELTGMGEVGVRVVPVYERAEEAWEGERGMITPELVRRHLDPTDGRPFLVAGPPAMVAQMQMLLDELGVEKERRIIEWFGAPVG